MSGDVQPRKRKDKKRKKDELCVEEPRGTAAALGEGDVFIHSHHDHGTGGHWCAKIIFFSLLAVLITLIGLIILENRGLTELEANSVESRYSGVLEGWLEDAPDDDHHDEHTLELKHHDEEADHDDVEHSQEIDNNDEDDHNHQDDDADDSNEVDHESDEQDDEAEDGDDGDQESDERDEEDDDEAENEPEDESGEVNDQQNEDSEEHILEDAEVNEEFTYRRYVENTEHQPENDEDDQETEDDLRKVDDNDWDDDDVTDREVEDDQSVEKDVDDAYDHDGDDDEDGDDEDDQNAEDGDDDVKESDETNDENEKSDEVEPDEKESREQEDEEEHGEEADKDSGIEVEKLEKEISDEDALLPEEQAPAADDDASQEISNEVLKEIDEEEFLEVDDIDEVLPVVENIKVPSGKPLAEVEEDTSEKPQDTLADEEEYEKRQEELRREKEGASHMWLKLVVGGALVVATHAVVRRATAPRDTPASDDHAIREETPLIDRRMTLIPAEAVAPAPTEDIPEEITPPIEEEIVEQISSVMKSAAPIEQESDEDEEDDDVEEIEIEKVTIQTYSEIQTLEDIINEHKSISQDVTAKELKEKEVLDKELYSDEEEEEEEIALEEIEIPKQSAPILLKPVQPDPEPEDDDVEIIDDEQLDEELDEELEEEDISDVDDAELLSRLEAKYGRLPEPHRPEPRHKDGGDSIEDEWPGEPGDVYWRRQLDQADNNLRQGEWSSAIERASATELKSSGRAKWILARALDASAEARRDNVLLTRAIAAYLELLKMNERLSDKKLLKITNRTLERINFRGNYLSAEPVYRLLIRRFPDDPAYRNNLTVTFLMANRADLAGEVIKETLKKWPDDRIALAHHGFVLKTTQNQLEEAIEAFQKALKDDVGPATEPRFYYHLGDALLLLGRYAEAHEVHRRGAALGHFLSPAQRSLYNVERLESQPWWDIDKTPYRRLARALEKSWKEILKEGEAARALYEKEKEGLKERGEWSQLDLFVRGQEIPNRCSRAPVTCSIVRAEPAAAGCRRGQVKFSLMSGGTHVRPHVGPTNCRLRMHLGLSNTKDTFLRVHQETRQWQVGKALLFDDSFEHEVWHNGTAPRLVLIVDVWHPDLTHKERRALPAI